MPPIPQDILPQHPRFQLNSSGLAGFFGGDEGIAAMNTAQYYSVRRFLGFYNSPGGFRMAKHYGRLAKSRIWRGFFPDVYLEPHEVFSLDGGPGKMCPEFLGAQTGVVMDRIGHLGYLFFKRMRRKGASNIEADGYDGDVPSSRPTTKQTRVTIVNLKSIDLPKAPEKQPPSVPTIRSSLPGPIVLLFDKIPFLASLRTANVNSVEQPKSESSPFIPTIRPSKLRRTVLFYNMIPVLTSFGTSIASGLSEDWYAFSLILLGMVAHGVACFVLGSGCVKVVLVSPPEQSPQGDGLMTMEGDYVVVLGEEKEVFQLTRATISVEFPPWVQWKGYFVVGACCLLLMLQLLSQLFLIPQATLFGQILFLCSFGVSFLYNTYLSSIDKEDLQRDALGNSVWNVDEDKIRSYVFQNWTMMAISMLYVLQPDAKGGVAKQLLDRLLPNRTQEWEEFKKEVLEAYAKGGTLDWEKFEKELQEYAEERKLPSWEVSDKQRTVVKNMYKDWYDVVQFFKN
ncbi:hypothetical protein VKT23_009198 [Stygiomarasmius scandens]|uniref:Uncharacterized protein n=1 Tax=Marasmiellus scandens TaxID=2682957 RepID=A0ABR1IWJ1_9AGAR